jgi:hypothetical protein
MPPKQAVLTYWALARPEMVNHPAGLSLLPLPESVPKTTFAIFRRTGDSRDIIALQPFLSVDEQMLFSEYELPPPTAPALRRGEGMIMVVAHKRIGSIDYYLVHYAYMYGDGHVEEDDIPWDFRYGPGEHDPFASHDRHVCIQPPPAV